MSRIIYKNNPAFSSEDDLVNSFKVRLTDLDLILRTIKENRDSSNQHMLIMAPRGMGKTMLVLRTAAAVRKDMELSACWYPLVFSEESYTVGTAGEFWHKALFHLGKQTGAERWKHMHEQMKREMDDKRLYDRALAGLMDFSDEQGKRILVIVENLNMLLGEQISPEGSWSIRHTLQTEPRIMLLATATANFDEIENSGKAMFDLFDIHKLEPLDTNESRVLWCNITGREIDEQRIRPFQILTGGNPRLISIISSFAADSSFRELMKDLTLLIDDHTSYFKSNIEGLPPLERKVFVSLANIWEPATSRSVSREARIDINKTSSLLNRLVSKGAVMVAKEEKRKKSYQVAERLYNIYHLMRVCGDPSSRVRIFVDFMIHCYESRELAGKIATLSAEACDLDPIDRIYHVEVVKQCFQLVKKDEGELILSYTAQEFLDLPDVQKELRPVIKGYRPEYSDEIKEYSVDLLRIKLEESPDDESLWRELGIYHHKLEQFQEAEKAYRKATEINSNYFWAWLGLGMLLHFNLKRYEEAEESYRKAIKIDPMNARVWISLAFLLENDPERYEEAERAYRKALEIEPHHENAWYRLGMVLEDRLERHDDAEKAFRKAVEIDPGNARAWYKLGFILLQYLNRFDEAEEALRKSIEIDPKNVLTLICLGVVLAKNKESFNEAEQVLKHATELAPEMSDVWSILGCFLHRFVNRYAEAELTYHKALKIDGRNRNAWEGLIELSIQHEGSHDKVLERVANYFDAVKKDPDSLIKVCKIIFENNYKPGFTEAEEWARDAIEKIPGSPDYLQTLASILGARMKWDEALKVESGAIKDPDFVKNNFKWVIPFFINAAAAGFAEEGLIRLQKSESAKLVEPLVVALQMMAGEDFNAPQEVVEVATDIVKITKKIQGKGESEN